MTEEIDRPDIFKRAMEAIMKELVVTLVATGTISRREAAKTLLRAEVTACLRCEDERTAELQKVVAGIFQSDVSSRLGAKPEFYALRKEQEKWKAGSQRAAHPWEAPPAPEEPEDV